MKVDVHGPAMSLRGPCCGRLKLGLRAGRRGFTLIEILLTVVLLMLLMGAIVINFSGMQASTQLDEAAEQLESAIRYARAYAANSGCKVRLVFEEKVDEELSVPLGNMIVEWEPDAIREPGVYMPLHDLDILLESMLNGVEINEVRAEDTWGQSAASGSGDEFLEGDMPAEETQTFAPITFFPDGTSDSAEIILASRSPDETRRISVSVIGATGVIRRRVITEAESADEQEWLEMFGE